MNDLDHWQERNESYLAAALSWLRLCLEHFDASGAADPPRKRGLFSSRSSSQPARSNRKDIIKAAEKLDEAATMDPPPALVIMSHRFGFSRFEQDILLLCVAMELDTRIAALCARAQDDPQRAYPTFALALALFDDPVWDALSPERPLRLWRLIEISQPGAQPLTTSPLRADERIVNYIKGLNHLDNRLSPLLVPFDASASEAELPPSQEAAVVKTVRVLEQAANSGPAPVVQVVGPDTLSQQLMAQKAAAALELHLYRMPAELLPSDAAELETLARLWQRESILLPIALYLDTHATDSSSATNSKVPQLSRFLSRNRGPVFLGTQEIRPGLGPANAAVEVDKPTPAEQGTAWAEVLGQFDDDTPALLAGQFNLNVVSILRIAQTLAADPSTNGHIPLDRLWEACLATTRPRLDMLAQRLDPKATWNEIVLPSAEMELLRQIADQVGQRSQVYDAWGFREKMNRGLGISALFTGASGTGKTMAAEVIANDLRLNLYRIDLSAVVSKYIGETEKNLRRLFDAAEDGGAILFFDEADALFGKRSEVKDSHDRYANIEINYLLQRMEAYRGLAILATNMKKALDTAFLRRLRFIVNFPFPGRQERQAIWERMFPEETPTEGLDFERLAKFNLTGGSIHNVALNAAFLAAQAGAKVTMPLVLDAARGEFHKLERPVNEADYRWQPSTPVNAA